MSRHPRSNGPADQRVTIRLTNEEHAEAQRLAALDGVDLSTIVRRFLLAPRPEEKTAPFVDARHGKVAPSVGSRWCPTHVFTIHHVPNRSEPLIVRRRVLSDQDRFIDVEGPGHITVDETKLCDDDFGRALSNGNEVNDDDENPIGLGVRVWVFDHCPSAEDIAWWKTQRAAEQDLIKKLRRSGRFEVWATKSAASEGPDVAYRATAQRIRGSFATRGSVWFATGCVACLYDLAPGRRVSVNLYKDNECAVSINPFSAASLAADGDFRWQRIRQQEQWKREAEQRQQEANARQRASYQSWADDLLGIKHDERNKALLHLGLTWPCTVDEVRKQQRARTKTEHADLTGNETAMRRTNEAAQLLIRLIEKRAA